MPEIPNRGDVYSTVAHDYDHVDLAFHESYDSTVEFGSQIASFGSRLQQGARVLVVGGSIAECGYLVQAGFEVTNVDISTRMAERIRGQLQVKSIIANVLDLQAGRDGVDEGYDGVWACRSMIHLHPEDFGSGLRAVMRLLHDGGIFGCAMFVSDGEDVREQAVSEDRADVEGTVYYRALYSEKQLRRSFESSGFNITLFEACTDSDGDKAVYIEAS